MQQVALESRVATSPLVVDLDGTLLRGDLLHEAFVKGFIRKPWILLQAAFKLIRSGKAGLKGFLASEVQLDARSLPYNSQLLTWLAKEKAAGRKLVLATASHRILAEAVAAHIGLFDEVLATDGNTNLRGETKRDLLVARYGTNGFDYVGDSPSDIPVWLSAGRVHLVGPSKRWATQIQALPGFGLQFEGRPDSQILPFLRALRPHQWLKNLLVFIPAAAAHQLGEPRVAWAASSAFVIFSMVASCIYVLNDLADLEADRNHPRKRSRPLASGLLSIPAALAGAFILLAIAYTFALSQLPGIFLAVLSLYFALTLIYSLFFKRYAILDVLTLASLYTMRLIAGSVATGVPLSFWLLCFSMFIFLSLAFVKRFSELHSARHSGREGMIRGRGYSHTDLEIVASMGVASGLLSVLVLAFYIQDPHSARLYHSPKTIWLAVPLLLFWISRIWLLSHRGQMTDDPIVFSLKDSTSWLVIAGIFSVFLLAGL